MQPKVAYLLKKFPRLSETFVLNEVLAQQRAGNLALVISRRVPDNEPRHPALAELQAPVLAMPGYRELDPWRELFGTGTDFERQTTLLRRIHGELLALDHRRAPELLAEALWLLPRLQSAGIDHVHAHFATDSAVVAWILWRLGGPGYSITAHAKDIYRNTVNTRALDRLIADSRFCVTVCDANVRHLEGLLGSVARSKLRRLYNGIDLELFAERNTARDAREVLGVGRLIEKKGFHVLLDAAAELRSQGIDLFVTLIGEGEERQPLELRAAALGLSAHVRFAGALDQEAVRQAMARAALMCLPCLVGEDGNRDALPTVLLEAQASGLPCISTPVTGIPEILDQGRAGLLVPESDVAATATAMRRLLVDAGLRASIAVRARAHAQEHFDLRKSSATLAEWFRAGAFASRSTAQCTLPA